MEITNLDHLGLVAGIIDEIGIESIIDRLLPKHLSEKISSGQVVKAMIINALGLVSAPLYLFARFFEGKAIEHLIGVGVKPEYLNDDKLGRVMDELYEIGIGEIFVEIALSVLKKYQLKMETSHIDSSSFHVHGEYKTSEVEVEPRPIKITHGYSRDHRPDLKQYTMQLICSGDGGIPLWIKMGDGNASDQKEIPSSITEFKKSFEFSGLMVADAALYTQENLQILGDIKWLSRVPLTIKAAKKLVTEANTENFISCEQAGYRYLEVTQNYGDIEQRWLVIESQERRESDLKKLSDKIDKDLRVVQKKLKELSDREFACAPDAIVAAKKLLKKSLYHELTDIKTKYISTKSEKGKSSCHYQVQATISQCIEKLQDKKNQAGRFILATNQLDKLALNSEKMLSTYKNEQQKVERCFKFVKDPMFFVDSVFIKSPKRIEALGLIMALSLLVYKVAERQIRQTIKRVGSGVKNQLGRLTDRPTLRWIFQCFQSIHIYIYCGGKQISNINDERLHFLKFFPPACQRYYLLESIM